jgi:hypothetical protein
VRPPSSGSPSPEGPGASFLPDAGLGPVAGGVAAAAALLALLACAALLLMAAGARLRRRA